MSNLDSASERWVADFGLAYNPFQHFEASADPHLGDYVVGNQAFSTVWGKLPALVFGAHGGGKTAMRLYAARQRTVERLAFPVAYDMPTHGPDWNAGLPEHLEGILRALAISLFLALAFRPSILVGLGETQQRRLVGTFADLLPAPLEYYLAILTEERSPSTLPAHLDTPYLFADLPEPQQVLEFSAALAALPRPTRAVLPTGERIAKACALVLETMPVASIDLYVDGVDGTAETFGNPLKQAAWLLPLLEQAPQWAKERIVLRAFIPTGARTLLAEQLGTRFDDFAQTELVWEASSLAELLQRRLFVASGGLVSSLDAFATPDVQGIEASIAAASIPLPREALLFVSQILSAYVARVGDAAGSLERQDIERASQWYTENTAWVEAPTQTFANSVVP